MTYLLGYRRFFDMPERFVIALDQGTTSSRAILVDCEVFEGKYIVK